MRTTSVLAVVTGANRGVGLEVVRQLADRGLAVILTGRDEAKARAAAATADGDVRVGVLDVSDQSSVERFADRAAASLERLDILVNNAGILYDTWETARDADLAVVHEALETNLLGAWRLTQALLPLLERSPNPRIVNVSSGAGSLSSMSGGAPAYSVSKTALNALTRLLAAELPGMRVNAVCPGWVATDMGGPGGRPVAEGAAGIVWAATLDRDGPTGGFFRDGRPVAW
jgi:NAD(P)-dependent dehydrogenase (short-subunit alcohol dehydrogenase family)